MKIKSYPLSRGAKPEDTLKIAKALRDGGVRLIEITLNSPNALESIELISQELGEEMVVGAGTVLDPETARAALLAGSKFILSPTVHLETIKMTKKIWCS
ncbi:bifunctional 4-hydroxy-2-oxoglutarate aldolase/2-dehydro-3-deoxy-phosphogluconate aldolase [Peribacillus frigoritolerans]|nr:bifunctional 4-hydroxy-2-oxoglutarate aldolase/2-dehydro-3-deoxy-phosphogluconate aldolase [Peribacillus frigoritolerans]